MASVCHPAARVEWSEGWAYTEDVAWSDARVLGAAVPGSCEAGVWEQAVAALGRLDPYRVFGNGFLDRLLRRPGAEAPRGRRVSQVPGVSCSCTTGP